MSSNIGEKKKSYFFRARPLGIHECMSSMVDMYPKLDVPSGLIKPSALKNFLINRLEGIRKTAEGNEENLKELLESAGLDDEDEYLLFSPYYRHLQFARWIDRPGNLTLRGENPWITKSW